MKKKKSKKKIIIVTVILIILIFIITLFKPKKVEEPKIETEKIEKRSIGISIAATGTIQTDNTKNVVSTLTGSKIESVNVKEGDKISVGDIICKFDTSTIQDNLNSAKQTLNITKAQGTLGVQSAKRSLNEAIISKNDQANIGQNDINTALKAYQDAQNQLNSARNDLANKQNAKNSYSQNSNFSQIKSEYSRRENIYNQANNAYEAQVAIMANTQNEYNKYFGADGITQLDPSTGAVWTQPNQDGEFATSAHRVAKNTYISVKTKLSNLENSLNTAKSNFLNYKSTYDNIAQMEAGYQAVVAEVIAAEANVNTLQTTVDNLKNAYEKSIQAYNSAINTANSTIANMQDNISNSELSSKLNTQTQETQLKTFEDQLKEGVLTATVNGTVTSVMSKPGDIYSGTTIAVIEGCEEFIIEANIDEYDIADIEEGMKVLVKTDATREEELQGRIIYTAASATESVADMSTATTSMPGGTATYKVKIALDSQNDRLRLGMNAKLSIITDSRENVWAVPYEAIHEKENGNKYIEILKNEQTREKEELEIKTGLESSYYVEIISDKITDGMQVVLPEVKGDNSMETIIELMGADAGM